MIMCPKNYISHTRTSRGLSRWLASCVKWSVIGIPFRHATLRTRSIRSVCGFILVGAISLCLGVQRQDLVAPVPIGAVPIKQTVMLKSPRSAGEQQNTPMAAPVPRFYQVNWTYPDPLPMPGLLFEIEYKPTLDASWKKIGETDMPPFVALLTSENGFFRIGVNHEINRIQNPL